MDSWKPLAPLKRPSGNYARADLTSTGTERSNAFRSSSGPSIEERLPLPPSDPFPPVGIIPRFVALHILSFLPLADQVNCARAGRSLAAAVADERNWSRRLEALDWCKVDGLRIDKDEQGINEPERSIGRRRKVKPKEARAEIAQPAQATITKVEQKKVPTISEEDEFGDFAGPSTGKQDLFTDFVFDKGPVGGSFASGTASVALGRGQALQNDGLFSSQTLSPSKSKLKATAAGSPLFSFSSETRLPLSSTSTSFRRLRSYANALRPYLKSLRDTSGPATSSLLFTCDLGLSTQAALLSNLLRFISTSVGGCRRPIEKNGGSLDEDETALSYRCQEAAQHLSQTLLSSFEGTLARRSDAVRAATHGADTTRAVRRAEEDMRMHANGVWELGNARLALALSEREDFAEDKEDLFGRMKAARAFLDRREVFNLGLRGHNPLDNVLSPPTLDFTPMDQFMADLLEAMKVDCEIIAQVFPPEQDILLAYADRVANQIISVYIKQLLDHTKEISKHMYLRSCAATFVQVFKIVKMLVIIEPKDDSIVSRARCENVVFLMWESNMEEYLETEGNWVREEMEAVTEKWDKDRESETNASRVDAAFINSQNPAAVKRSVLSGFKDVLLLPVTVVPRTAGIVGGAMIRTAGSGLSSLNPRRWQSGTASTNTKRSSSPTGLNAPTSANSASSTSFPRTPNEMNEKGYMDFSNGAIGNLDSGSEDDELDEQYNTDFNEKDDWSQEVAAWGAVASARPTKEKSKISKLSLQDSSHDSATKKRPTSSIIVAASPDMSSSISRSNTPVSSNHHAAGKTALSQMQLLLSLDTALQVIHINRDCLKRIETFLKYPLPLGERVRVQLQDVSLLCLRALGQGHINPGFKKATEQIRVWKPEDHAKPNQDGKDEEQEVEPLIHFFELVHVGDTIAQMVQVYFDQELSRHIDGKDFLNPVIKGKKKFESNLDEAVAKGLNAGVDLLLGQAEHIITTKQDVKDYFPDKGMLTDLNPTKACREAVECLQLHCRMLVGAADKNVLEVFYQEVGIRLYGIIGKHLKKQIISIDGGFKVIADLNHYHAFVATLKQPSVTADFDHLKMLGNIFIIDNPKELAKIARDASMFGGALSPEDLYDFLHSRSDFKLIEKAVDKEMYGFKVSEDCIVA